MLSAMQGFIFAAASVALALEEADHADVEEHLSLLQLSARPRSVAENSDDFDAHDVDDLDSAGGTFTYPITWDTRRSFGPDGTWATPYCPYIKGCTKAERVCPAGCNGEAYWEAAYPVNSELGILKMSGDTAHYLGCIQGQNPGTAFGSFRHHDTHQNCNNGPDSDKPAITSSDAAWVAANRIQQSVWGKIDMTQTFYQNEYCPADCVNDCAIFKHGQFLGCGSTMGRSWAGYNGGFTNAGPNPGCSIGTMTANTQFGRTGSTTYTWCGEQTTTTTTTPAPPPVEEPVDELAGDEAAAAGDPHMISNTGRHFDLE